MRNQVLFWFILDLISSIYTILSVDSFLQKVCRENDLIPEKNMKV